MVTTETRKAVEAVGKKLEALADGRCTGQIVIMVEQGRPTWIRIQQDERIEHDTCTKIKK